MIQLTSSIVLYKNDFNEIKNLLTYLLQSQLSIKIVLIDNSPTEELHKLKNLDSNITYLFNNKNLGYGKGHNIAIKKNLTNSPYHLVLNPDIKFKNGTLESIFKFMQQHKNIGQLMPKVFYTNGELQKLCNPLPKPINLVSRRFFLSTNWAKQLNNEYELRNFNYNSALNVPNLSGCFMFLRNEVLQKVGLFDERYFMYMEDIDLCRRIHAVSQTVYYPEVSIIHGFEKESYTNKILLKHHIQSAIKYFNKWGWFFDKERDRFNKELFNEINSIN